MKKKEYIKPLGKLLITVESFIHSGAKIGGKEYSKVVTQLRVMGRLYMERIPVEILEELKELIEGEIIFRSRKEEESSLQLLDSRGTIH